MTTDVQKVGQTQATQQSQPKQTLKPDARIEVFEGMTIEDVEQNGSEAQKIVAAAFDTMEEYNPYEKGDGKYDKYEARNFNNYRFALDKNNKELRAHNIETNGHVTIKYNNLDELKKYAGLVTYADDLSGNITFNLRTKTATFENVQGYDINVGSGTFDKVIIRNADVSTISAWYHEGTLKLEGVADRGILWDSATRVEPGKNTRVSVDSDSKIEIQRYEDEE